MLRKSKFNSISLEEMVLAFRINSQCDWKYSSGEDVETIEIFGNHISVHYIAKVLSNYVLLRSGVEKEIGNIIDGY